MCSCFIHTIYCLILWIESNAVWLTAIVICGAGVAAFFNRYWIVGLLTAISAVAVVAVAIFNRQWIEINSGWLIPFGTLIAAIGTVSALVVALFKDSFIEWRRRPKLNIKFKFEPPDCQLEKIKDNQNNIIDSHYYRIRVSNKGIKSAQDVVVLADKLEEKIGTQKKEVEKFLPMFLKWTHEETTTMASIPGYDMYRFCDIGKIIEPSKRHLLPNQDDPIRFNKNKAIFSFEVKPIPNSLTHLIGSGKYTKEYILTLKIGASNCKPIEKKLRIFLDGKWDKDEKVMINNRHIKIDLLKKNHSLWD